MRLEKINKKRLLFGIARHGTKHGYAWLFTKIKYLSSFATLLLFRIFVVNFEKLSPQSMSPVYVLSYAAEDLNLKPNLNCRRLIM